MKKPYSLDYTIERDIDRVKAVNEILDTLSTNPNETDLEQMGSYILYGKDENGLNAVKRGEILDNNKRFNSYKKKDDKLISLDGILESPLFDQQSIKPSYQRINYVMPKPCIKKPKYDKEGGLVDPGDSDIPGMVELWDCINRLDKWIQALEGKREPEPQQDMFSDDYRLYRLKHSLIDLRRQQYYLKDSYKPALHFQKMDRPRAQFIDWTSDSSYWISLEEWQRRVREALLPIDPDLNHWETRKSLEQEQIEVKWVVRHHTFNWEDPLHVRALMKVYEEVYEQFKEKVDTYGRTLIFDFDRYCDLANFSPVRRTIIKMRIEHYTIAEINEELMRQYGIMYNENHLNTIMQKEIPEQIALAATRVRLLIDTPLKQCKRCCSCGRTLPINALFFARNRGRKDGFSSICKECDKRKRIDKGGQSKDDNRYKNAQVHKMQS